jgi:intracellular septation protein
MDQDLKPPSGLATTRPLFKVAIDFGPLLAFFAAYLAGGIYWATGTLMAATMLALAASWQVFGHIAPAPVATAVLVIVFGGLTFWLDDPRFIKIKPTIINLLFAGILFVGLVLRRPLLKLVLGDALRLTEEGWQKLTVRWALFFLSLAALNEMVWRNFSETAWVNFKVFGILPLTVAFAVLQLGFIKRHEVNEPS